MYAFLEDDGIRSISFLHNNAYETEDFIVCGSRGWYVEEKMQNTVGDVDYTKIVTRESGRLEAAIKEAETLRDATCKEILVYLHFPPVYNGFICREIVDVLHRHELTRLYFGHIHGNYTMARTTEF